MNIYTIYTLAKNSFYVDLGLNNKINHKMWDMNILWNIFKTLWERKIYVTTCTTIFVYLDNLFS